MVAACQGLLLTGWGGVSGKHQGERTGGSTPSRDGTTGGTPSCRNWGSLRPRPLRYHAADGPLSYSTVADKAPVLTASTCRSSTHSGWSAVVMAPRS